MKKYSVIYTNDFGQLRLYKDYYNKKRAIKDAKMLIESNVYIDVFEIKKVERITLK